MDLLTVLCSISHFHFNTPLDRLLRTNNILPYTDNIIHNQCPQAVLLSIIIFRYRSVLYYLQLQIIIKIYSQYNSYHNKYYGTNTTITEHLICVTTLNLEIWYYEPESSSYSSDNLSESTSHYKYTISQKVHLYWLNSTFLHHCSHIIMLIYSSCSPIVPLLWSLPGIPTLITVP